MLPSAAAAAGAAPAACRAALVPPLPAAILSLLTCARPVARQRRR